MSAKTSSLPDETLTLVSLAARMHILELWQRNHAPLSGSLSAVEIYTLIYSEWLSASSPREVRFIPKTTSANTVYGVLAALGWDLDPSGDDLPAIPQIGFGAVASSLKLGTNIYQALGLALAAKRRGTDRIVIAVISDGELQSGVDHAAKLAAAWRLQNLVVIIDHNGLQSSYPVSLVDPTLEPSLRNALPRLRAEWEAYGWDYAEVDGHAFQALRTQLNACVGSSRPAVLVAHTVKGKGVHPIEGDVRFNHEMPIDLARIEQKRLATHVERRPPTPRTTHRFQSLSPLWTEAPPVLPTSEVPTTHRLRLVLSDWLTQFVDLNEGRVMCLNTDNPLPFRSMTPAELEAVTTTVGINERGAVNIARGVSLEGCMPIYVSPAAHLTSCAEDFAHGAIDQQRLLMIGVMPGSELARWGPSHTTYRDIDLFSCAGAHVFQAACGVDLTAILNGIYTDPQTYLPAYLRLPRWSQFGAEPPLTPEESKRAFREGCYERTIGIGKPDIVFVASGVVAGEALRAATMLHKDHCNAVRVINLLRLAPIDESLQAAVTRYVGNAKAIVAAVDGDSATMLAFLVRCLPRSVWPALTALGSTHPPSGRDAQAPLEELGLDAQALVRAALELSSAARPEIKTHLGGDRVQAGSW